MIEDKQSLNGMNEILAILNELFNPKLKFLHHKTLKYTDDLPQNSNFNQTTNPEYFGPNKSEFFKAEFFKGYLDDHLVYDEESRDSWEGLNLYMNNLIVQVREKTFNSSLSHSKISELIVEANRQLSLLDKQKDLVNRDIVVSRLYDYSAHTTSFTTTTRQIGIDGVKNRVSPYFEKYLTILHELIQLWYRYQESLALSSHLSSNKNDELGKKEPPKKKGKPRYIKKGPGNWLMHKENKAHNVGVLIGCLFPHFIKTEVECEDFYDVMDNSMLKPVTFNCTRQMMKALCQALASHSSFKYKNRPYEFFGDTIKFAKDGKLLKDTSVATSADDMSRAARKLKHMVEILK